MSGSRRRRTPAKPVPRRRSGPTRDFWGTATPESDEPTRIEPNDHPTALIQSLGPLPFPGGQVAQHYFEVVYERASMLALALATSAGIVAEPDDDA